jgi:serine/threonine-protein kinase RsbW
MSDLVVRLSFPAKPEYLLLARLALTGIARDVPVSEELLADLKLAVTEACGNSARHAYPDGDGDVAVVYTVRGEELEVVVEDNGVGVEGSARIEGDPSDGGMGMSIIRALVDSVEVAPGEGGRGTVVRMTKRLSSGEG